MKEIDLFLSKEFVEFSEKIKEIMEIKEKKHADFKVVYDAFKKEDEELKASAEVLKTEFEVWKNSKLQEK